MNWYKKHLHLFGIMYHRGFHGTTATHRQSGKTQQFRNSSKFDGFVLLKNDCDVQPFRCYWLVPRDKNGGHLRMHGVGIVYLRTGQFFATETNHSDSATYRAFLDQANKNGIIQPKSTQLTTVIGIIFKKSLSMSSRLWDYALKIWNWFSHHRWIVLDSISTHGPHRILVPMLNISGISARK